MKKKIVAMLCLGAILLSMAALGGIPASAAAGDWIDREPVEDADYSFAVMGDIQNITYTDTKTGTKYLESMISWILDNREERNIQHVFGLGDTVETLTTYPQSFRNRDEWDLASSQISRLNGNVSYSVVRGNHDDEAGYHKHICTEEYLAQMEEVFFDPTKDVTRGNSMSNSYQKLKIGNHKYLILNLDYHVTPETMVWANDVIYENYDYQVIVSIHAYLHSKGILYQGNIGSSNLDDTILESLPFDAEYLWENIFSRHSNVFMILSGHIAVENPIVQTRTGVEGNEVIEILVDPQNYDKKDPSGILMLLNFTEGGEAIEIEYFSPSKGKYFRETNQITLTLPEGTLPTYEPPKTTEEPPQEPPKEPDAETEAEPSEPLVPEPTEKEKNPYGLSIGLFLALLIVVVADLVLLLLMKLRKKK